MYKLSLGKGVIAIALHGALRLYDEVMWYNAGWQDVLNAQWKTFELSK